MLRLFNSTTSRSLASSCRLKQKSYIGLKNEWNAYQSEDNSSQFSCREDLTTLSSLLSEQAGLMTLLTPSKRSLLTSTKRNKRLNTKQLRSLKWIVALSWLLKWIQITWISSKITTLISQVGFAIERFSMNSTSLATNSKWVSSNRRKTVNTCRLILSQRSTS